MSGIFLRAMGFAAALCGTAGAQWQLTWSDEFDGASGSRPDPGKWVIEVVPNPHNNEAQYYTDRPANVRLNGTGQLELTALKEPMGNKQYTSGRINGDGKFTQLYGRWEARMKMPGGQGLWPAFWMMGSNDGCGGWPACGEIDIMEHRGRLPRASSSAMHGPGYSGDTPIVRNYTLPAGKPSFTEDYHLFAAEWSAAEVRFLVDDTVYYTVKKADVERYGRWAYDRPFYALLNLAVGGHFDDNRLPPDSALPAKVFVDYVRVFKPGPIHVFRPLSRSRSAGTVPMGAEWRDLAGRLKKTTAVDVCYIDWCYGKSFPP